MSHIKRRKHAAPTTLAFVAAGMALSPFAASAQDATGGPSVDDQTRNLGHVEVVGEAPKRYTSDTLSSPKFTRPLLDTTRTIQEIRADLFNEQGGTNLTEALRTSPGIGTRKSLRRTSR